jgi:hypothetical protein
MKNNGLKVLMFCTLALSVSKPNIIECKKSSLGTALRENKRLILFGAAIIIPLAAHACMLVYAKKQRDRWLEESATERADHLKQWARGWGNHLMQYDMKRTESLRASAELAQEVERATNPWFIPKPFYYPYMTASDEVKEAVAKNDIKYYAGVKEGLLGLLKRLF